MEPIPIEDLKSEKCARISAEDLIDLCELAGPAASRSPSKKSPRAKPKILIIDIRSPEEYPFCNTMNYSDCQDSVKIRFYA